MAIGRADSKINSKTRILTDLMPEFIMSPHPSQWCDGKRNGRLEVARLPTALGDACLHRAYTMNTSLSRSRRNASQFKGNLADPRSHAKPLARAIQAFDRADLACRKANAAMEASSDPDADGSFTAFECKRLAHRSAEQRLVRAILARFGMANLGARRPILPYDGPPLSVASNGALYILMIPDSPLPISPAPSEPSILVIRNGSAVDLDTHVQAV